ncbi:ferrous iron transport protein A [Sphingobacterium shayense]|uniref:FeoA family protein n=1 Tax=Sphingobacterium shayense TaxID=626343 RepID=UPI001552696E|nr:FeoA family protein [Sphingobacterium shayense]NQD71373.1 ferrous iron transport protein A [Sphingobacterium shayense]
MQESFKLDALRVGEVATIRSVDNKVVPSKFFELGLLPGTTIEIKHKAPFSGPIGLHIHSSNTLVAIRKSEAAHIFVSK